MIVSLIPCLAKRTNKQTNKKKHLGPNKQLSPTGIPTDPNNGWTASPASRTCKTRTEQVHGHDDHLPVFFCEFQGTGKLGVAPNDLRHEMSTFPEKVGTNMYTMC